MEVQFVTSINDIEPASWHSLSAHDYPFSRYEFLAALENSGAVDAKTGWQPLHAVLYGDHSSAHQQQDHKPLAVMPLYLKQHSYGEYVFDWSWANAYQQHGYSYYPKLITAIPFTPAHGPRILTADPNQLNWITNAFTAAIIEQADRLNASSWHCLFPNDQLLTALTQDDRLLVRKGCQFHWYNKGYQSFDDFLATFNSRKRKNLRKERQRVEQQGIELRRMNGAEISTEQLNTFYEFYQSTYLKRGQTGYLNHLFFQLLCQTMPEQLVFVLAYHHNDLVAGALCFKDKETLYGRYWGCKEEYNALHFEACYYQGIEYCIEHNLNRFDSGAQGEHKIQRGFTPITTWSTHWIAHPGFRTAIDDFVQREADHIDLYINDASDYLPFKADLALKNP